MLLEEFDSELAVTEPKAANFSYVNQELVCDTLIYSFNGEVIERLRADSLVGEGGYLSSINGRHPWYLYEKEGVRVAVMLAPVGAALAVALLEELRVIGFKRFVVFGSCGVLDSRLAADRILLPASALRDEGTSYHYAPASEEIAYEEVSLLAMEQVLLPLGLRLLVPRLGRRMLFTGKHQARQNAE